MNELQRLLPRHFKVVELCLMGMGPKQIASELGMSPLGVSNIVNDSRVQDELARRRVEQNIKNDESGATVLVEAKGLFEKNVVKAANVHIDALEDDDVRVRQSSANAILQRAFQSEDVKGGQSININVDTMNVLSLAIKEAIDGDATRKVISA